MDNVLIAQAIAEGKNEKSDEFDYIKKSGLKTKKIKLLNMSFKIFLQYMATLWSNKQLYDVKSEIQKYRIWSKNAENAYQ